jgi:hypothetical protein
MPQLPMHPLDGGPAFPSDQEAMVRLVANGIFEPDDPRNFALGRRVSPGMSLRDYFAGQALGSLFTLDRMQSWGRDDFNGAAEIAYRLADAVLAAREATHV